jgi:hypothetical protein
MSHRVELSFQDAIKTVISHGSEASSHLDRPVTCRLVSEGQRQKQRKASFVNLSSLVKTSGQDKMAEEG